MTPSSLIAQVSYFLLCIFWKIIIFLKPRKIEIRTFTLQVSNLTFIFPKMEKTLVLQSYILLIFIIYFPESNGDNLSLPSASAARHHSALPRKATGSLRATSPVASIPFRCTLSPRTRSDIPIHYGAVPRVIWANSPHPPKRVTCVLFS